jgi:uncharacterized repeat protein (TIGR01451 family)
MRETSSQTTPTDTRTFARRMFPGNGRETEEGRRCGGLKREMPRPNTGVLTQDGLLMAPTESGAEQTQAPELGAPAPAPLSTFEGLDDANRGAGHPPDTVGPSGSGQNLRAGFTPTDSTNYNAASADVSSNVLSAVLSVSMIADRNPAPVGLNFNYKATITNTGSAPSDGTVLTDVLPSQVTFASAVTVTVKGAAAPPSAFIPAGAMVSPAFTVTTNSVNAKQTGLVTATSGPNSVSRGITINVGNGTCP